MQTCAWLSYQFEILSQDATWNDVGGIYIFSYGNFGGLWNAVYIGQTSSFMARIPSHERWEEARQRGATHVHALVVPDQAMRDKIEQALIAAFHPHLNSQFNLDIFGLLGSVYASQNKSQSSGLY